MPVLANSKHEAVAQAYLAEPDKIGWRAYKAVYSRCSQHGAETGFGRLLNDPDFAARLAELSAAAAEGAVATARQVLEELTKIGLANMLDYMRVGTDGNPVLDFSRLTRDKAAAIHEVTVESFVDGRGDDSREVRRVKFKLTDKLPALTQLAKHHKLVTDKVEHDVGPTLEQLIMQSMAKREPAQ
jgi:phage terminase small subunit